jgi:hypothetical protein
MKLHLKWSKAVPLKTSKHLIYDVDLQRLPAVAGLYVFARQRKDRTRNFEALYIGQAKNVRQRVRGQLKNLPLMLHLQRAKQGQKMVIAGTFAGRSGQQAGKSISIAEKALIRHFLSEAHDLVNKQGTRLLRHEITSDGNFPRRFIPKLMYVDKGK